METPGKGENRLVDHCTLSLPGLGTSRPNIRAPPDKSGPSTQLDQSHSIKAPQIETLPTTYLGTSDPWGRPSNKLPFWTVSMGKKQIRIPPDVEPQVSGRVLQRHPKMLGSPNLGCLNQGPLHHQLNWLFVGPILGGSGAVTVLVTW